ncbi:hypothetical protein SDC9_81935 [bioreactor metagenome]|uniref:Uncharacterized protein n=1 Tax=bioreactor metagenome TaxID=1076179 RepID=A0A644ZBS6_9ZZZZ
MCLSLFSLLIPLCLCFAKPDHVVLSGLVVGFLVGSAGNVDSIPISLNNLAARNSQRDSLLPTGRSEALTHGKIDAVLIGGGSGCSGCSGCGCSGCRGCSGRRGSGFRLRLGTAGEDNQSEQSQGCQGNQHILSHRYVTPLMQKFISLFVLIIIYETRHRFNIVIKLSISIISYKNFLLNSYNERSFWI